MNPEYVKRVSNLPCGHLMEKSPSDGGVGNEQEGEPIMRSDHRPFRRYDVPFGKVGFGWS